MDANLFKKLIEETHKKTSVVFVPEIDREVEVGGNWCKHRTSGGYTNTAIFDGKDVEVCESEKVQSDDNQYHIGCPDGASLHRVTGGTFLVTRYVHQGDKPLVRVFVTPSADLGLVTRAIDREKGNWKELS